MIERRLRVHPVIPGSLDSGHERDVSSNYSWVCLRAGAGGSSAHTPSCLLIRSMGPAGLNVLHHPKRKRLAPRNKQDYLHGIDRRRAFAGSAV